MLFLWKTTKLGKIWIEGDAVKQMIAKRLPETLDIHEITFIGDKDLLNVYITAPETEYGFTRADVEQRLSGTFERLGMNICLSWLDAKPQNEKKKNPLWTLPLFWAAVAACITALFHMGLAGIAWSVLAAIAGYGVSWIVVTEDGRRQVKALTEHFRR